MRHARKTYCCVAALVALSWLLPVLHAQAQHPRLTLTQEEVAWIRAQLGHAPLFDRQIAGLRAELDAAIEEEGIQVPVPRDMAGGYTHERHKRNFFLMQKAGNLYQITGEERYAEYVRQMLLAYAKLYPTLGLHPTHRSYATGKIFWQCLNDANWLVYVSQAYDCIYDYLPAEERALLERDLFRPMADFLSVENPQFFNRIHNHSTWGNAAVGMIGLVMGDDELVQRALYGLEWDDIPADMRDNDGGFIRQEGQYRAGFLAQLDYSFSPDGYFTEGPYYLRYAIFPFLVFARALDNHRPELDIFGYRDSILTKAVYALLNLTDAQGRFFPINDAQKGMSWQAREVVTAVDVLYARNEDPGLLSIARLQGRVLPDAAGLKVALGLEQGLDRPFVRRSMMWHDGPDGKHGGLAVLRSQREEGISLVLKYTAHGMGHGHFDRLSCSLYDETGEVLQDYGAARWVNIDQKGGGRYLPENQTWAKQTIAHNTVVVDRHTQCEGKVKIAEKSHPDFYCFRSGTDGIQAAGATDTAAWPGVHLQRIMILIEHEALPHPLVVDLFRASGKGNHTFDLPYWFQGHLLTTSFPYEAATTRLLPAGTSAGYQHLWVEAQAAVHDSLLQLQWFGNGKFYTLTTLAAPGDSALFVRTGAMDPEFNLRRDPAFVLRKNDQKEALFASVLELHGAYNPAAEIPESPFGIVGGLRILQRTADYLVLEVQTRGDQRLRLFVALGEGDNDAFHSLVLDGAQVRWKGPVEIKFTKP